MSIPIRFCRWEKGTVNLSKMRDGELHTETPLQRSFFVVVTDPTDDRKFTLNIATQDAARELLSAIALQFPELLE